MKGLPPFSEKNYTCLTCGECCGAWNLPVEDALYDKLKEQPLIQEILQKESTDFKLINNQIYLPKKEGICVFMDPNDNLCRIHRDIGPDFKPLECHRFPFAFAKDKSGGLYYDTSFYCKAIANNHGNSISQSITPEFLSMFDFFEFPDEVLFSPKIKVSAAFEEEFRLLLATELYKHCSKLSIDEWKYQFYKGYKTLCTVEKDLKQKKEVNLKSLQNVFENQNISPKQIIKKFKLANAFFLRKKQLFPDVIKLYRQRGDLLESIIAEPLDLNKVSKINIPEDKIIEELFLRYFLDVMQRKVLLAHGHSIIGIYIAMMILYNITLWYSQALARANEKSSVEYFHAELAVRITERYYSGHNLKFMELFRNEPTLKLIRLWL